jgi:hypothetical protein
MTQADSVHSTPPTNTPIESPAESAGALFRRTDISPEVFFQALGRARRLVRDEIERLIDWLDSTIDCDQDAAVDDGPCDEDSDAEPSLGSFDRLSNQLHAWKDRGWGDVDAELDRCDDEPALAAPEQLPEHSQERWANGVRDDREGDCDDPEAGRAGKAVQS